MTAHVGRIPMAALAIVGLFAVPVHAAGTVVGSKHDLRLAGGGTPTATGQIEVCVSCHTPHQAATANSQDPLWNHTGTALAVAYGVYSSATLNALPLEIGGVPMGGQSVSALCMSCHDGTVSVISMYNPPNVATPTVTAIGGRILASGLLDPASAANVGTDLTNDHPINFVYSAAQLLDPGLKAPGLLLATTPLFGGTVQCASCHDVHDPTNVPFLTMSNLASALCTNCHIK